ncbi:MAG: alanine--tRNA ligase-related protein [Clostridiales bacterium]|nr:MAG: alanine--tRNA ligase-related protein [Clostridiales bacterium]
MLGRWSLGDYFKEYAISCSYDFLLNHLEFDKDKFAVTVFKGDEDCPRDDESAEFWKKMGVPEDRIFFLPKETTGGGLPALPVLAVPTPKCSSTPENPNAPTNVRPRATAASTSKSATTSLCNTSKTPTAPSRRLNKER